MEEQEQTALGSNACSTVCEQTMVSPNKWAQVCCTICQLGAIWGQAARLHGWHPSGVCR